MASKADEEVVEVAGEAGLPHPEAPYSVHLVVEIHQVIEIHAAGKHSAYLVIRPHSQTSDYQAMCSGVSRQCEMPIPREQTSDGLSQKTAAGMLPQHLLFLLISRENAESHRNAPSGLNPYHHLRIPSKSLAPMTPT
jgi:hypothetical protein